MRRRERDIQQSRNLRGAMQCRHRAFHSTVRRALRVTKQKGAGTALISLAAII
jgi:hypothetical protein